MENVKVFILVSASTKNNDLFIARSDTSSVAFVWAMTELIRHPKVRKVLNGKRILEEGDINKLLYLSQVIKETLRLHPIAPLVPRLCHEIVELAGYTILVESRVRVEERTLDFEVANFQYIPFGGGRRICPGVSFALASIELWLAQKLFYFNWELPRGRSTQELDVEEAFGLILTRKNDLCLASTHTVGFKTLPKPTALSSTSSSVRSILLSSHPQNLFAIFSKLMTLICFKA
ncbi:hypothetical protein IEQ34_006914 [Dendrobium chrysotoxum]|uniref:Cytochrome P450 n=1 Tax=Dendrobium chrysotoxum TaxID=161865 RepID=A0AAV7H846_DENCH|nr:hypothetical protein IEQ34_006914 [Dendrobium chrysotoxum]